MQLKKLKQLCTLICLTVFALQPTFVIASTRVSAGDVHEKNDDTAVYQLNQELDQFNRAKVSLSDAMQTAETLHAGALTADISFDGSSDRPIYIVKSFQNNQLWQDSIDAATGRAVGASLVSNVADLESADRTNVLALTTVGMRMTDAVTIAETSTLGRAIGAGLADSNGALVFVIAVVSESRLMNVVLEPSRSRHQPQ